MSNIFSNLFSRKRVDLYTIRDSFPDKDRKLKKKLSETLAIVDEYLNDCDDVITRDFYIGEKQHSMSLIYIDGLANMEMLQKDVLKPLMVFARQSQWEYHLGEKFYKMIKSGLMPAGDIKAVDNFGEAILAILSGDSVLFLDKFDKAIIISSRGWEKRSVEEPSTEAVIRGPRDGFTENYRTNVALVRRRLKNPNLKVQTIRLGRHTRTDVGIMYIRGVANPDIVEEVLKRLNTIDMSGITESGYIEQMIEDDWLSPFPQLRRTERPDVVSASLIEGNIAIIPDNTPFILLAPATFLSLFQSPEDYYERWYIATVIRILRFAAAFAALTFPALYIAMTSFHPGMIPTDLALSIAATREGVPFSAVLEALIMVFALEVLREAGIRLPGPIGQTIGIVGGLVVGEAAVRASLVSPIMVIIVALYAISSFSIPNYSIAIAFRLLTFIFMFLASIAGLYGIMLGLIGLLIHLVTLKSFGAHYLSPFISFRWAESKDTVLRAPFPAMKIRPGYTHPEDLVRMRDLRQDTKDKVEEEKDDNR